MKHLIYVIEDDENIRNLICVALENFGHRSEGFETAEEALERLGSIMKRGKEAYRELPSMFIFDWMLPGMDGYAVLKNVRSTRNMTPVLMLTARSELSDRVRGLDAGADYYLTKPFATEEFLACLRAVRSRNGDIAPDTLTFGDLILTPSMPELICGENSVSLSAKELELMSLLIQNSSQYLPKETLLLKVWGYDANVNSNSVEAYISFLRKKLSLLGSCVSISVMRNIGYKLGVSL